MAAFTVIDRLSGGGHGNEVVATRARFFAEFDLVRVPSEVGIEREGDEVLIDEGGFDLFSGVPPGAVSRAGSSCPPQRAAVSGGEDDHRFVLCDRASARLGDVCQPIDLAPRAFARLGFDDG